MSNTIQGQSLFPHQADFVKLYDKHKKGCFLVCKSCRQVGKSFLITQLALRECINNKNFKTIIVTPTFGIGEIIFSISLNCFLACPKVGVTIITLKFLLFIHSLSANCVIKKDLPDLSARFTH